jgi:hypothetical protein
MKALERAESADNNDSDDDITLTLPETRQLAAKTADHLPRNHPP